MTDKPEYHVVNFSGGKDSTAMLLMMIERGMHIDEIVCCDTGLEFPGMYEHWKKVEEYIGRKITILKADKSFEYWFCEHVKTKGKRKGEVGYGWPSMRIRWCTDRLKQQVTSRYFKELQKKYNIIYYDGIAYDERERVKDHKYPLVDWNVTEQDALQYCYEHGFDWGGLYEKFDRVSCWCCPLQPLDELRTLRKDFPELWNKLLYMDSLTDTPFRGKYKVADLDARFEAEELEEGKA